MDRHREMRPGIVAMYYSRPDNDPALPRTAVLKNILRKISRWEPVGCARRDEL